MMLRHFGQKLMGLNILIASDHYPPFIGGAHRQTQLLSRKLVQSGHRVAVATVWQPGLPTVQDEDGVTVYRLKQVRALFPGFAHDTRQRHQPPFPDPITIWQLRKLLNEFQPDIVHAYGWFSYSCAFALLGKNIPLLVSARDYAYSCPTRTLVYHDTEICSGPALTKCLSCAAHHYGTTKGYAADTGVYTGRDLLRHKLSGVHSISTYVQDIIERDFLETNHSRSGHDVVEAIIPSFREDDREDAAAPGPDIQKYLDRLPKEPFILFVGALRLVKGLEQLLAAYERLDSPPPLVLIGTVESDTPRVFPKGVVVLESFPHKAVMAAWDHALFGVIPSLWPEPLGSVVYEGMSRGKAVIGTMPGGHTDMIVHHETGLLVPQADVDALADAMRELLDNPELRERLGRAARVRARLFTAGVVVPRFEQLYQQLVNESTGHTQGVSTQRIPMEHENPQYSFSKPE
jgi:glycosyltransferase involved in cell wall biosynthesis